MTSKKETDSLRPCGCEKLLKWSLRRPNFFHFQKANGNLFFNPLDDDFRKDNFVTKIFLWGPVLY